MGTFWKGKWAREGKKSREGACFPPPPPPSPARAASRASQLAGRSRVTACAALKPTFPKSGVGAEAVAWMEAAASAGSIEYKQQGSRRHEAL